MRLQGFLTALALCSAPLCATERLPWLGNLYELELRANFGFTGYPRLNPESGIGQPHHSAGTLSGVGVAISPFQRWSFEVEGYTAATTQQSWSFSHFRATARHVLMDDVIGDPVTVTVGGGVLLPTERARRDWSQEHRGEIEAELFASVGKEYCNGCDWIARAWITGGVVASNRGAPWIYGEIAGEFHFGECSTFRVYARSTRGLGGSDLDLTVPFYGYGPIDYGSSDVGFRYSRAMLIWGTMSVDYSYRPYAHNAPSGVHNIALTYLIPFSL